MNSAATLEKQPEHFTKNSHGALQKPAAALYKNSRGALQEQQRRFTRTAAAGATGHKCYFTVQITHCGNSFRCQQIQSLCNHIQPGDE